MLGENYKVGDFNLQMRTHYKAACQTVERPLLWTYFFTHWRLPQENIHLLEYANGKGSFIMTVFNVKKNEGEIPKFSQVPFMPKFAKDN